MIIDFHTHAFADAIAERAISKLVHSGGALIPSYDGTIRGLTKCLEEVDGKGVVLTIATKPSQQRTINNWAKQVESERIICFGTVHPDAPDALDELDYIKAIGLKGIKLHAECQNFFVDDPKYFPLYRKIGDLGLICVFHSGKDVSYGPPVHCTPEGLSHILDHFHGSPVVAAHFGAYLMWEDVLKYLAGREIYFDTAYCQSRILMPVAREIVAKHGTDKLLFGSDSPWNPIARELTLVDALELTPDETNAVKCGNACRLLHIPQ